MNWAKGITGIRIVDEIDKHTPAAVETETGIVYLATNKLKDLNADEVAFLLLHEFAHIELQSQNELLVDAHASDNYLKMGFSPRASVTVMAKKFTFQSLEQKQRAINQLRRAYIFDKQL